MERDDDPIPDLDICVCMRPGETCETCGECAQCHFDHCRDNET
jgi:hypothetical protein